MSEPYDDRAPVVEPDSVTTLEEVEQPLPTRPTQPASSSLKMSELETARLENFFLKIQNLKMQKDKLSQDLLRADAMILELQKGLVAFRNELSAKYSIDFGGVTIQDGILTRKE